LASGRVLAADIRADATYPPVDRSMMDGYAFAEGDESARYWVIDEVQAGSVPAKAVAPGECVRIFTGAELPPGAGRVIPQEYVERDGEWMIPKERATQKFVRRRGTEAKEGDVVLRGGMKLGAADLAILAQVGVVEVPIHPAAWVDHMATGNELAAPDAPVAPGEIRDTNSTLIAALVSELGARLTSQERCGDNPVRLQQWATAAKGDLLLISGGASVGEYDFGARALRAAGFTIHFDKVNLRPGKPLTFATRGPQAAFVIPGNPVSHFVCFNVAIRLAIECLQGDAPLWESVRVRLGGSEPLLADRRLTYWPARVSIDEGRLVAEPRRWSSSGDTFSLAGTNALLRVAGEVAVGAEVPALLLQAPR
jgi:molybdopterin molybdotransferase